MLAKRELPPSACEHLCTPLKTQRVALPGRTDQVLIREGSFSVNLLTTTMKVVLALFLIGLIQVSFGVRCGDKPIQ